jgi:hypothetical protein
MIKINNYSAVVKDLRYFTEVQESKEMVDGSHLIRVNDKWYMLSDNGGETNVSVMNGKSISIPHAHFNFNVTPNILAYRIATYLNEGWEAIKWNINDDDIENVLAKYKSLEAINYKLREVK